MQSRIAAAAAIGVVTVDNMMLPLPLVAAIVLTKRYRTFLPLFPFTVLRPMSIILTYDYLILEKINQSLRP